MGGQMGTNAAERSDAVWAEKCKRIGRIWFIMDERIQDRMEKDEMAAMKISFKQRAGGYLVILEGVIAGKKVVQFKDIASMADAAGTVQNMLEDPAWKESKPFPVPVAH